MIVAQQVSKRLASTDVPLAADNGPWMAMHRAAEQHAQHIGHKFLSAIERVRDNTHHHHLVDRLAHGDMPGTIGMVSWEHINREYPVHVAHHLRDAAHAAALSAQSQLSIPRDQPRGKQPGPVPYHPSADFFKQDDDELSLEFDLTNPRVEQAALERAAQLVTGITDETRAALRDLIARALRDGIDIDGQARLIRNFVGLTRQQMNALLNFRRTLIDDNRPAAQVERMTARQYQRSLNYRARMIARTESIWALNAGQRELWRQASERGLFAGRNVKRKWITQAPGLSRGKNPTIVPCDICYSMRNQEVGLDEPFVDFRGIEYDQPGAHPMCVCALGLVFAEPEQSEPSNEEAA